jgi:hypothetical protein
MSNQGVSPHMMTAQISPPPPTWCTMLAFTRYPFRAFIRYPPVSHVHTGPHQFHAFTRSQPVSCLPLPQAQHWNHEKETWNMNIEILQHPNLTCATSIMNVYSSLTNRMLHATWMETLMQHSKITIATLDCFICNIHMKQSVTCEER